MAEVICFDNVNQNLIYSNWFVREFEVRGEKYVSIEQFMMHEKASLFGDESSAARVMELTDAAEIKALGRQVKNYNDHLWNGVRQLVVYEGAFAKFSQNLDLREALLATGDAYLAECEPSDKIWGIGLAIDDPAAGNPEEWQGQNLLGYTLMSVRKVLASQ